MFQKLGMVVTLSLTILLVTSLPALAVNPVDSIQVQLSSTGTTSDINLSWYPVLPSTTGDTITYSLSKSVDGGKVFSQLTTTADTAYTDYGVANYTDVTYRVVVTESGVSPADSTPVYATVYPPDTNPHSNYASNTNACALCHQTHTAVGPSLLTQTTTLAICETCHWQSGTNSKYNVKDGETATAAGFAQSLGGPMDHLASSTDVWGNKSTTSAHSFDNSTQVTAPGGYPTARTLTCTSCHDPHYTGNYRLLKSSISYPTGPTTVATATVKVTAFPSAPDNTTGESASYLDGTVSLCAACHQDYNTTGLSKPGETAASGTFATDGMYRHAVGLSPASFKDAAGNPAPLNTSLPLEGVDTVPNNNKIVCLTCHYAHGTAAIGTAASSVVGQPDSTMLKRLDNSAVCQDCHKK